MPRPASLAPADSLLGEAELDTLVAPVALYPDALLAQVLVAATYPLQIVKAERWLAGSEALDAMDRADKASAEDWDPSVRLLAGGFPDVIRLLAKDIEATEALGDAVLAQTDGVLDAIQRQRARAAAAGNLASGEELLVETKDEAISIASTDPDVVYVPQYDPATVYAPATGVSTGAMIFGSALLFDEVFDDDDWDDYWYGPPPFDWDDDAFYPGDIVINGDVNIDGDGPVRDRLEDAGVTPEEARERLDAAGVERGDVADRIGDREPTAAGRQGAFAPSPEQREAAQARIAAREGAGGGARATQDKLRAGSGAADSGARGKLEAATAKRGPATMPSLSDSMLKPGAGGPSAAHRASDRGNASLSGTRGDGARPATVDRPKSVSRPSQSRPAVKRSPPPSNAFRQSGGSRASAASHRGHASRGGGRGGGGRGGGGRR